MKELFDKEIFFDESYVEEDITTWYFRVPVEWLPKGEYPCAVGAELSLEFPSEERDAYWCSCMLSPTEYDEETDVYTDTDWFDYELSVDDLEALLDYGSRKISSFSC